MENLAISYKDNVLKYPEKPPFTPCERFPEYPYSHDKLDETNYVYSMVKDSLIAFGLDSVRELYDVKIPCLDLRSERVKLGKDDRPRITALKGDPLGLVL